MNAYRIDIWRSVKHNNKFIANNSRIVMIHARNEIEAKNKIILAPSKTQNLPDLIIDVSGEFIYSTTKIGTVTIQRFYVYSTGMSPISVKNFKMENKRGY